MKKYFRSLGIIFLSFIFASCVTTQGGSNRILPLPKVEIEKEIRSEVVIKDLDKAKIREQLTAFQKILKKGKPLSKSDWALHDSLLDSYKQIKYRPHGEILTIPPKMKITIPLHSYCLEGGKADPDDNEVYRWRKVGKQFIFLREILALSSEKKHSQKTLQSILWNLKNKTYWENYPDGQQEILLQIDPEARKKIPSELGSRIKDNVVDIIRSQAPDEIEKVFEILEGEYYDYATFEKSIKARSTADDLPSEKLVPVEGVDLLSYNQSEGFDAQTVSFYNISDKTQTIDLKSYYQESYRKAVQALAAFFGNDPEMLQLLADLEKVLFSDMMKMGLGFTPVLGDLIDLYEASTGKDFFSNEWLTPQDRFLAAMGILAGSGSAYRYADKVAHGPASYVHETEKKYRNIRNEDSYKRLEDLANKAYEKGMPKKWKVKVTKPQKENQGLEFVHPDRPDRRVRIMPGNPDIKYENSQKPYVRVKEKGSYYGKNGEVVPENSAESHIPLDEFDFSKYWGKRGDKE